jgi:hypothetical protein
MAKSGGAFKSKPVAWAASSASFVAASALQVATYAVTVPSGALTKVADPVAIALAAIWLLVPATLATILSVRGFQLIGSEPKSRSTQALVALSILPLLSVFLGVAVSFNLWGGK